jgi:hypothetical protein
LLEGFKGIAVMLKVIPVEAIGMPLAHDITEIVPGNIKVPPRRGHIVRRKIFRNCST